MEQRLEWEARSQCSSMIVQHGGGVFAGWRGKGCLAHDSAFFRPENIVYNIVNIHQYALCHLQVAS